MPATYRPLTQEAITTLTSNGCRCGDWSKIEVSEGFSPAHMHGVRLQGSVRIGANGSEFRNREGVLRVSGIYNTELIDCTIGDHAYISGIGSYIANYHIGERAYIENCGKIACTGRTAFGNGTMVKAVNENGGRQIPIFSGLSAQTAYIMAMYRHRPGTIAKIETLAAQHYGDFAADRGYIGQNACLCNCGEMVDMHIAPHALLCGAASLRNGTVNSTEAAPSYIGTNVIAEDFICTEGSTLDTGAAIKRCFVGEGAHIANNFTAVDSLFFANCEMEGGEAASVFAGPYSVSHHKSSLMIAGYFLFFNAGSGSNQSNHLFKAGAVHEGIHERGVKFASNAYVMQPAREGAFNVVIGRHTGHHDTSAFPYSILNEEDGRSYLIPAANLTGYGVMRDLEKWPHRDNRKGARLDAVNFEEYNPYIGSKVVKALELCRAMLAKEGVDTHNFQRTRIKSVMLRRGQGLYATLLDAILGHLLSQKSDKALTHDSHWVDMGGMFAPKNAIDELLAKIDGTDIKTIGELNEAIAGIHADYQSHSYAWAMHTLATELGHAPTAEDIAARIAKGKEAHNRLTSLRHDDLKKDCSGETMMTGYGIDAADKDEREADFKAVRRL